MNGPSRAPRDVAVRRSDSRSAVVFEHNPIDRNERIPNWSTGNRSAKHVETYRKRESWSFEFFAPPGHCDARKRLSFPTRVFRVGARSRRAFGTARAEQSWHSEGVGAHHNFPRLHDCGHRPARLTRGWGCFPEVIREPARIKSWSFARSKPSHTSHRHRLIFRNPKSPKASLIEKSLPAFPQRLHLSITWSP